MKIINWMLDFLRLCGSFPYRGRFPQSTYERSWSLGLWCFVRIITHGMLQALQFDCRFQIMQVNDTLLKIASSNLTYIKDAIVFIQTMLLVTRSSKLVDVLLRMKSLKEECKMSTGDYLKDPLFILTFILSSGLCIADIYKHVSLTVDMMSKGQWQWVLFFAMIRQALSFTVLPVIIVTMHLIPKFLSVVTLATVPPWQLGPLKLAWHTKGTQHEAADESGKRGSTASTVSLKVNDPSFDSFFTQAQARLIETEETFFRFVDYMAPVMLLFSAAAVISFTSLLYLLYEDSLGKTANWFRIYAAIASFFIMVQPCIAADSMNQEVKRSYPFLKDQFIHQ